MIFVHGMLRESDSFADILAEERGIARAILEQSGAWVPGNVSAGFTPSLYDGHVELDRAESLEGAIEDEQGMAALIFEQLYPSLAR